MGDTFARFTFEHFLKTFRQSALPFYLTDLLDFLFYLELPIHEL